MKKGPPGPFFMPGAEHRPVGKRAAVSSDGLKGGFPLCGKFGRTLYDVGRLAVFSGGGSQTPCSQSRYATMFFRVRAGSPYDSQQKFEDG